MKFIALAPLAIAALACSGCKEQTQAEIDANVVAAQKGRWQFIPANPPYPAMVFDTATGCAEPIFVKDGGDLIRTGMTGNDGVCILQTVRLRGAPQ